MSEEKQEFNLNPDAASYLGLPEDVKDIESFKSYIDSEFVRRKNAHDDEGVRSKMTAMITSKVARTLKNQANEFGIELSNSDIEGKQYEEVSGHIFDTLKNNYESKIKELETQISDPNEALKEFEGKYSKLEKRAGEYKSAWEQTKQEFDQFKSQATNEMNQFKINTVRKDALNKLPYKLDISDIEREGFNSILKKKYKFDLDESGNPFVTDAEGNRIPSSKKAGEFKGISEVFEDEANELGLLQSNPHAKNNVKNTEEKPVASKPSTTNVNGRKAFTAPFGQR